MTGRDGTGLIAQLRNPPGGRDARVMLAALFVDRSGSGVWGAAAVLYFAFVAHLDARQIGLLLGTAATAGIAGSPLAGRLAARYPLRPLLIGCHLLRAAALCLILSCDRFAALLPMVAVTALGDRGARTLEMIFATRVAGSRRSTYQALSRTASNAGYAVGAAVAAASIALGTRDAYRALVLVDVLSFLVATVLVRRAREPQVEPRGATPDGPAAAAGREQAAPGPWRNGRYLRFVLLDIVMSLDDSVLNVGLPLWLATRTSAPHALVPAFLVINTVLVVVLQLRVSARAEGPRRAVRAVFGYGVLLAACCVAIAVSTRGGPVTASIALTAAAVLVTMAELMRSVSSWELAVSLAPPHSQASYLGVAGMSQSVQKSVGPLVLTGAVMVAGPPGWLLLGGAVAVLSVVQGRGCERFLDDLRTPTAQASPTAPTVLEPDAGRGARGSGRIGRRASGQPLPGRGPANSRNVSS
ncbi:MFS transporter [Kitasatospora paranensis]|uniref:MFS transporter n=1 Tax=Kitasatospora paranensis TaxID=258053 RepID=A0ABW2FQZ8_9ACTN